MPNDSGFDMAAFKSHLDAVYHNRPTDIEPPGLDLFTHPAQPISFKPAATDPLQGALAAVRPTETPGPAVALKTADAIKPPPESDAADAARNKLAQEALLANPAEMRKLFPALLKDVSLNHNDHLDIAEIDKGLQNAQLSQSEKNFLTVLKKGYKELSLEPCGCADPDGVSANGLAVVDKALNRQISDDPIYADNARQDIWKGVAYGAAIGAITGFRRDARSGLIMAGLASAAGILLFEGEDWIIKATGGENKTYDRVEQNYKAFASQY
jgi:hypothetical protein